jgi:thiamine-phosphate pyrophosphorylase
VTRPWRRGLYAVTDPELIAPRDLASHIDAAIEGGAVLVQYRDKTTADPQRLAQARTVVTLCHSRHVPLIVNDDIALAAAIGADGVHLGRDDAPLAVVRQHLGPDAIIGVSCYNDLPRAVIAAEAGADYVAFGRFFPSHIKPHAVRTDVEILSRAKQRLSIPVVAIGGITADNGDTLIAAGADMLAVIHGIFGQNDVTAAARSIARLFDNDALNRQRKAFRA